MYIPEFAFEEEDIETLKRANVFLGEYTHKKTGFIYYKLNSRKIDEISDILYSNDIMSYDSKVRVEFNIRMLTEIFTGILNNKDRYSLLSLISEYSRYNTINANLLMKCLGKIENDN